MCSSDLKNGNHVDKSVFEAAIKKAEIEMENLAVSITGLDVDNKKWWVTPNEYDIFRNILKNVTRICKDATTDEEVLCATTELKERVSDLIKIK